MVKLMSTSVLAVVLVAFVVLCGGFGAEAVTCNPSQLSPCVAAISTSAPPSSACCGKLREQRPCLCGYLKQNPKLRQYLNSPNVRKVSRTCGVAIPNC